METVTCVNKFPKVLHSSTRNVPPSKMNLLSPRNYQGLIDLFDGRVSPVMDLDYDLYCSFHTPEILQKKMRLLSECGFKRVYIVAPPPGNPDYSTRIAPQDGPPNYLRQSRNSFGKKDPLEVAVHSSKAFGMKVFIIMKPYEQGGAFTVPHGFDPPCNRNWIKTLSGRAVGVDPFILEHPEFLVARKPYDSMLSRTVDKVVLVFVPDESKGDSSDINQAKIASEYPASNFQIFTSADNGAYTAYNGNFKVSERFERRMIVNANGESVYSEPKLCRIIELSQLDLKTPFFAVKFDGDKKGFRTIPYSLFHAYSGNAELPVTVSQWIRDGVLTGKYDFSDNGFEFEKNGMYYWDCGWHHGCLYGFARGKEPYVHGNLCEAYPEVRAHWMNQINRYIKMGCDGVDIRIDNHGSSMTDFVNYGYNPPLVQAYRDRFGVNILTDPVDPIRMMKLRGEFLGLFVREAADVLHEKGLKIQIHMKDCYEHPTTEPTFHSAGFWCEPKVVPSWHDVIDIVDEVTIKDYNFGRYNSSTGLGIKNYTVSVGKPLWIHCYLQQGHDLNPEFLDAVKADSRVSGLMLYEVVWNKTENDGIVRVETDGQVNLVL